VVFDDICIRNTTTPIDIETTYIDANAPREGWVKGTAFPLFTDITLLNVQTEGGSRLHLMGFDAQHVTEVKLDGVQIAGIEAMKQQASNARITLGPGPSNWVPKGDNVRIEGIGGKRDLPDCTRTFVEFPAQVAPK
jgi:polygalacturonase